MVLILETICKLVLGIIQYTRTRLPPEDSLDEGGANARLECAAGQAATHSELVPGRPDSNTLPEDAVRQTA